MQRCDECQRLTRHKVRRIGATDYMEQFAVTCMECGLETRRWVADGDKS